MACARPRKRSGGRHIAAHITKSASKSRFFSSLLDLRVSGT